MHQAFEHCDLHHNAPKPSDSLASMCWPIIHQEKPLTIMEKASLSRRPQRPDVSWPVSEPWRRNVGQPRCGGKGRCQGDPQRCNSKYRYGVDDVGPCPSEASCHSSYKCQPCPPPCPQPCPESQQCKRQAVRKNLCRAKCVFPVDSQCDRLDLYDPVQEYDPRLTTRCFQWPLPSRDVCPKEESNMDMRPPRPNLNHPDNQPERCPTCKRTVVDVQCGPIGYNF